MSIISTAKEWLATDPHEETQHQLRVLIEQAGKADPLALQELHDSFSGSLQFGTAGLRGKLGPGPNRMNVVVVARAAAGLATYLNQQGPNKTVVIGYDARHNSKLFAQVSAQIFSGAGITTLLFPDMVPTPVLAFAIRHLGADAGVMVTASHNPPQDNGYKVYLGTGSQIVSPVDTEIATCISQVAELGDVRNLPHGDTWQLLDSTTVDAYIQHTAQLIEGEISHKSEVVTVYSAMHGVGGSYFMELAQRAGFPEPVEVVQQFAPDPAFPTVAFPNPEEPGAMDLSIETAIAHHADLIIANDPDADRCAVAIPTDENRKSWRMLHGDEVGALLAMWIGSRLTDSRPPESQGVMAQSIVSCTILEPIAHSLGFSYEQTLTGFKWIGPVPNLVYGYEEALGYCVDPQFVKDKDGLSAALKVLELTSYLKSHNKTLQDELDRIALEFGVYSTDQVSIRVDALATIDQIMLKLRINPPTEIAGTPVREFVDLASGAGALPPTDGLMFTMANQSRVIVRPSGTEPKVKVYLQSVVEVKNHDVHSARVQAASQLQSMATVAREWLA